MYKKIHLITDLMEAVGDTPLYSSKFGLPTACKDHTWQTIVSASEGKEPTALSIKLEGSIDGVNWFTLDSTTNTSGETKYITGKVVDFIRCKVETSTLPSGSDAVVNVWYIGK